jgi:SAM-dependent methyltransferase/uncharacterized protein YbaR (Trm112 family)
VRREVLAYLACPDCSGTLDVQARVEEDAHIMEGSLSCGDCQASYSIVRGVPRFAGTAGELERRTAQAFGYEWTRYAELAGRYRQQFLDWIQPVQPEFFRGRTILEGGCGKGRHTALAADFGARAVVALDLSEAVESAFANTRDRVNVHIVQADLNRPPTRRVFDYVFSIGVLHHLPEPERGFHALVSQLRPGGAISVWVYGREGNGWIVRVVTPLRERVTARMPHGLLDRFAALLTVPLYLTTKLVYGPARTTSIARVLPYAPYLGYIAAFPFREQRSIVFDHLVAPVAFYLRREELAAWFYRAGLADVCIEHHNANSWRGFGRVPASVAR